MSFRNSGGVDNLPFSVSGLLSFSASWYRALLFPYLLTHLVIYDACFKIWLRRTLNGFLLSGCPGCHLGEENKKLYWTLWVVVSVVKIKALSENHASRNRLLSVDYYLFHIKFMPWIPLEWSSCAYLDFLSVLPKTFVKYKSSRFLYRQTRSFLSRSSLFLKKGFRLL